VNPNLRETAGNPKNIFLKAIVSSQWRIGMKAFFRNTEPNGKPLANHCQAKVQALTLNIGKLIIYFSIFSIFRQSYSENPEM